jgi:hypothetical protein
MEALGGEDRGQVTDLRRSKDKSDRGEETSITVEERGIRDHSII